VYNEDLSLLYHPLPAHKFFIFEFATSPGANLILIDGITLHLDNDTRPAS
jgi:hypothetical protein